MNALPQHTHVAFLLGEAESHRALHHPYLTALKDGTLPDPAGALKRFASEYAVYAKSFQNYLLIAMSKLEDQQHRSILLENLCEESGMIEEEELAEMKRKQAQLENLNKLANADIKRLEEEEAFRLKTHEAKKNL